jgi:hypothetical protein
VGPAPQFRFADTHTNSSRQHVQPAICGDRVEPATHHAGFYHSPSDIAPRLLLLQMCNGMQVLCSLFLPRRWSAGWLNWETPALNRATLNGTCNACWLRSSCQSCPLQAHTTFRTSALAPWLPTLRRRSCQVLYPVDVTVNTPDMSNAVVQAPVALPHEMFAVRSSGHNCWCLASVHVGQE